MGRIETVGILGAGLIGMSWASLFLARGYSVVAVDPRPGAGEETARFVADAWPHLSALGLTRAETPPPLAASTDIKTLTGVDYVQENGPDRLEAKRAILAELEGVIGAEVIIASSTSSLMASDMQEGMEHPGRLLVAHPMNPPHLVPMVELVAGRRTAPDTVDRAEALYRALDRVPVRVKREVPGHLANRLTSALYREAVNLVAEGIADVADIDAAIASGPGLRWALMGPHLTYHLGGGAGGYRHYLDHLGPTQEARWQALGTPSLTEDLKDRLVEGVETELAADPQADTLTERRDAALVALLKMKAGLGF